MTLDQLHKGEKASIDSFTCDKILKSRFNSLGIKKEEIILVEEVTLAKETIEVKVNRTKIALRISEAKHIRIQPC